MVPIRIDFAKPAQAMNLGRNGWTHAHGLLIDNHPTHRDEVWIRPINSRGEVTKASLIIPQASIPDLILALQASL